MKKALFGTILSHVLGLYYFFSLELAAILVPPHFGLLTFVTVLLKLNFSMKIESADGNFSSFHEPYVDFDP